MLDLISELREWVRRNGDGHPSDEWIYEFPKWDLIYSSIQKFIDSMPCAGWSQEEITDLLYAMEIDNEDEIISEMLTGNAEALLRVARFSLESELADGRWQLAAYLGTLTTRKQESEDLLVRFADDKDEYVQRRALMSLGSMNSGKAEPAAIKAWQSGQEYLRIVALSTLAAVNSPMLSSYLQMAEEDGRESVVQEARTLMKVLNERTNVS